MAGWLLSKKQKTARVGEGTKKREPLVGMQNGAAAMENSVKVPQTIKDRTSIMIQQSLFWVFTQNNWNQDLEEILALLCSLQHYFH